MKTNLVETSNTLDVECIQFFPETFEFAAAVETEDGVVYGPMRSSQIRARKDAFSFRWKTLGHKLDPLYARGVMWCEEA